MDYVTKDQLDIRCRELKDDIDDVKDNHLNSILNVAMNLDEKMTRFEDKVDNKFSRAYTIMGVGFGVLLLSL